MWNSYLMFSLCHQCGSISPNISLGLSPYNIAVKVASFFDKSYNFSEEAFIKYLTTAPTSHVKLCFGKDGFIL